MVYKYVVHAKFCELAHSFSLSFFAPGCSLKWLSAEVLGNRAKDGYPFPSCQLGMKTVSSCGLSLYQGDCLHFLKALTRH